MEIILISLLTFVAAFVGTLSGFGLSTIMLPVMVLTLPFPIALLFVGIIHFFSDLWKVMLFREGLNWKLLAYFGIPGMLASFLGAQVALTSPQDMLVKFLGVLLVCYVVFITFDPEFKLPENSLTSAIGGVLSGIMAGIFGTGGAIRGAFLSAFELPKHIYIFSTGALGMAIDTTRMIGYLSGGITLSKTLMLGLLVYIPISLIAAEIAKKYVDSIPQNKFRAAVSVFLFFIGIRLLTQ